MKTVFENQFIRITIFEEHSMVKVKWRPTSDDMTDEQFKELGALILDATKKYLPTRIFSDTHNFLYTITPAMQTWFAENIIKPSAEYSIKNVAFLVSSDLFSQISVEQLMDEDPALGLTTRYFEEEQEAFEWISKA